MEIKPVDLTSLIPSVLAVCIPLVAVIGLVVRFAIKPIAEALSMARSRDSSPSGREVEVLAARVRELEEEVIRLKNADPYRVGLPAGTDPLRSGQGRG
jgi:hypothetical protein